MKHLITISSLALLLAACGGGGTSTSDGTGLIGENTDTVPALEYTADLKSTADFNFDTSRAIAIDFDVEQARTSPGLMSLCTDYTETDGEFDVNYDSCTVQSPLEDGIYSGTMDVTNDIDSVVGVIWFKDPDIAPIYQVFELEVGAKVARRGGGPQAIVWR